MQCFILSMRSYFIDERVILVFELYFVISVCEFQENKYHVWHNYYTKEDLHIVINLKAGLHKHSSL